MKFSGKVCVMIDLKVTEKQGLTPSLENTVQEKPLVRVKLTPSQPF